MIKEKRNNIVKLNRAADKYRQKGQYQNAIKEYENILSLYPHEKKLYNTLGDLYQIIKDNKKAKSAYGKYARALEENGYILQAIAVYKKILRLDDEDPEIYKKLAGLYNRQGIIAEAVSMNFSLAKLYEKQNRKQSAITVYEKLAEMQPDNGSIIETLVENYLDEGLKEEAVERYLNYAELLRRKNEHINSKFIYEKVLQLDNSNIQAIKGIINFFLFSRDFTNAEAYIIKALKISPDPKTILEGTHITDKQQKSKILEKLAGLYPDNIYLRQKYAFSLLNINNEEEASRQFDVLIQHHKSKGDYDSIIDILTQTIQTHRNFVFSYNALIDIYRHTGNEAMKIETMKELAYLYYDMNRYHEALEIFRDIGPHYLNDQVFQNYYGNVENKLRVCHLPIVKEIETNKEELVLPETRDSDQDITIEMTDDLFAESDLGLQENFKAIGRKIDETSFYFDDIIDESSERIDIEDNPLSLSSFDIDLKDLEAENTSSMGLLANLVSSISYEIRTPLTGVIGFLNLLYNTKLTKSQLNYASNALISAKALLGNIDNIIDIAMIKAGTLKLENIRTDIIELAFQALNILKPQAIKNDVELIFNIDFDLPRFAVIDPVRLRKIIISFLANSIKHTRNGEAELKITFSPSGPERGQYFFSVRDTGPSISPENQKKLFEMLSKDRDTELKKCSYSNLGIIVSNMITKKMGGKIDFTSGTGIGNTFFFNIETEYFSDKKIERKLPDSIKKVMILDDNSTSRAILERLMKDMAIDFVSVSRGVSAVKQLESAESFDAVFVDSGMPVIDGIEMIRIIREDMKMTGDKPALILLAYGIDKVRAEDYINHIVQKPFKPNDIYQALKSISIPSAKVDKAVYKKEDHAICIIFGKPKIMIAEDVSINMLLIIEMIHSIIPDAEIIEATNGIEVIVKMNKTKVDMILMDVQMPEMDGIEATRQIRLKEEIAGGHVPIIALSAGVLKEEIERCMNAGMDDFLPKPIDIEALCAVFQKRWGSAFEE